MFHQLTLFLLFFAFISPLSEVFANRIILKKNVSAESDSGEDQLPTNTTDEVRILESHELMQQEATNKLQVPSSSHSSSYNKQAFSDGKLIIHEEEPVIEDEGEEEEEQLITEPVPTKAMYRDRRQRSHREISPNASESLLELLVTIAGQPERWSKLIGYINTILKSPVTIDPDLEEQLKLYKLHRKINHTKLIEPRQEIHPQPVTTDSSPKQTDIQHMIIFLKGSNHHHRKIPTTTPKPIEEFKRQWPTFDEDENEDEEDESNSPDYRTEDEEKYIAELHKLDLHNLELKKNLSKEYSHLEITYPSRARTEKQEWPIFDDEGMQNDEKVTTERPVTTKPKEWFSFRRVTSVPVSGYDKTRARNAYIAVSVIAPTMRKYYRAPNKGKSEENKDAIERELLHLKPWSHRDNLNHMEKIRSKWPVIRPKEETLD